MVIPGHPTQWIFFQLNALLTLAGRMEKLMEHGFAFQSNNNKCKIHNIQGVPFYYKQ